MQYAEKVALVPQHYAEDREYKQIQKPGAAVARSISVSTSSAS